MPPEAELPSSQFWQFSVEFYARPGAAKACLALQDREGADVNLILLALWLSSRGHRLSASAGIELARLAGHWQDPIVRPLREVRRRLKQRGADDELPWAAAVAHCRDRLAETELALEHVVHLLLERAAGVVGTGPPSGDAARDNLRALGLATLLTTKEADLLLNRLFASRANAEPT